MLIAGIGAQYTVLLDNNGYVTGTKQLNGGPGLSSFTVITDTFQVAKPGATGGAAVPVFTIGSINGVQKIGVRGDMLIDGTVIARHIAAGSITADKISANAIGTSQLAVGGVDINNLVANAATRVLAYGGGTVTLSSPGTNFDLVSTGAINYPVSCTVVLTASMTGNGGATTGPYDISEATSITFGLYVDEALVPDSERTFTFMKTYINGSPLPNLNYFDMVLIGQTVVTPGSHTIKVKARYARTDEAAFSLRKNGVEFATMTFALGATVATFACAVDAVFAPNDVFTIFAPNPRDATLAGVAATIVGYR